MVLHEQANLRRAEDVRVRVVQQALAHAWRGGSDVWGASQAPDSAALRRADGTHGRPSQGAGGPRARAWSESRPLQRWRIVYTPLAQPLIGVEYNQRTKVAKIRDCFMLAPSGAGYCAYSRLAFAYAHGWLEVK